MPGYFSVGAHGDPNNMTDPNLSLLTPDQMAQIIRTDPRYRGQSIKFLLYRWTGWEYQNHYKFVVAHDIFLDAGTSAELRLLLYDR